MPIDQPENIIHVCGCNYTLKLISGIGKAIINNNIDQVRLLLNTNSENDHTDTLNYSLFHNKLEIFNMLINEFNVDIHKDNELTLLIAIENDAIDIMKMLVEAGADINSNNGSVLIRSVVKNNYDMVKYLLDYGANIHAANDGAFVNSFFRRHYKIAELLLKYGADIHAQHDYAINMCTSYDGIKILLEHDSNFDIKKLNEALLSSINKYHLKTAQLLIQHGANIESLNNCQVDVTAEKLDTINFLIENQIDPMRIILLLLHQED